MTLLSLLLSIVLGFPPGMPPTGPVGATREFKTITAVEWGQLENRGIHPVSSAVEYKTGTKLGEGWYFERGAVARIVVELVALQDQLESQKRLLATQIKISATYEARARVLAEENGMWRREHGAPIYDFESQLDAGCHTHQ